MLNLPESCFEIILHTRDPSTLMIEDALEIFSTIFTAILQVTNQNPLHEALRGFFSL